MADKTVNFTIHLVSGKEVTFTEISEDKIKEKFERVRIDRPGFIKIDHEGVYYTFYSNQITHCTVELPTSDNPA